MGNLSILAINGSDAASFLQGYVTSDLDQIDSCLGAPMALTDIKGRVLANGWTYGSHESVKLVIHGSLASETEQHLKRYMVFSKSRISQESEDMDCKAQSASQGIRLQPAGWSLVERNSGSTHWQHLTVDAHLPLVTVETSGMFLPQMLGLTDQGVVSFTKGCYLGQEVVARAQHRGAVKRRIQRYEICGVKPQIGTKLVAESGGSGIVVACSETHALVVVRDNPEQLISTSGGTFRLSPAFQ